MSVSPDALAFLEVHRLRQEQRRCAIGDALPELDLMLDRGDGHLIDPNGVSDRFKRLAAKASVPAIRFHALRHSSASLQAGNNVNPKVLQERLGHSSVRMTLDRYVHANESMQRADDDDLALGSSDEVHHRGVRVAGFGATFWQPGGNQGRGLLRLPALVGAQCKQRDSERYLAGRADFEPSQLCPNGDCRSRRDAERRPELRFRHDCKRPAVQ